MTPQDVRKAFGAAIREHRLRLGLSQEGLGERAELHRTYITDVERGARNLSLDQLLTLLTNVVQEINQENPNRDLVKSVKGAKMVKETNSLLFTGPSPVLQKISELLTQLDSV